MASEKSKKKIIVVEEDDCDVCSEEETKTVVPVLKKAPPARYFEMKYFQDIASSSYTTSAGAFYSLCSLGQGLDYYQRTGRSVKFTKVEVAFDCLPNVTSGSIDQFRVCVVLDADPKGNTPLTTSVFENLGSNFILNMQNFKDFGSRFKILYDWTSAVLMPANAVPGRRSFKKSFKIPSSRAISNWSTTSATLPETNSILIFVCNVNNTNPATFSWFGRSTFVDG